VVLAQGGARVLQVRSRGIELTAAGLDVGADDKQPVREARVMPRSAAPLSLSASSQSPIASSASIWFATSKVLLIPYRRITLSPACPSRTDSLSRPSIVSASVKLVYARARPR
jgi:hypothetical protein